MCGEEGRFPKGFAAGSQRTQRNVFNIPLTINQTYPAETLDRAFEKGNATGHVNGEQQNSTLRKIEFDAKNIEKD